ARAVTTPGMRRTLRALDPRALFRPSAIAAAQPMKPSAELDPLVACTRNLHHLPERTDADIDRKLAACAELLAESRLDRVRLWREMGRLEAARGNGLIAATYRLRAMRLAGADLYGDLPAATATLQSGGYAAEAEAAEALYGGLPDADERRRQLLDTAVAKNRMHRAGEWERIDDWRRRPRYRASVIVSLYNAADKLPLFLRSIAQQTLLQADGAELILVDSGSPGDEWKVWRRLAGELNLPAVYARSHHRETIQAAWNRALSIARGDYVSFLGVDEMLAPRGLETLARELDADSALDWVQADSLVTNVDSQGRWLSDVMTYDRGDALPSLAYLETCYLSSVGAMYRRDLHQRFGYYDGSFRGAGDTEFKNRVLPFLRAKTIRQTLGIFWNYPDARVTASPLAELEDLRAWYLHRTPAGVRYAFERRDPAEAENLLCAALRYRKSYCRHWSTDVEYAQHLASFLSERDPRGPAAALAEGIGQVLGAYRALDLPPREARPSPNFADRGLNPAARLAEARRVADEVAQRQARLTGDRVQPVYQIFNDNRHEQHANVWRAA
ncbi:MAG TPA: glycosyltransferase, partial [Pirellulales bacterium]